MTPRYREVAPPPALSRHVHCLWLFEGEEREIQRVVPDGRCELIVHYGAPYCEIAGARRERQPRALFAGQLTRPLHLKPAGGAGVVAVRFRPTGARGFAGRGLSLLTDRRIALADLHGRHRADGLVRAIRGAADDAQRLATMQDYVAARLADGAVQDDAGIEACIALLERGAAPKALCRRVKLSPRQLQRRFAAIVGVPPRLLAAIIRFRRVFDALRDAEARNWTEAAQAAGYFDQPQFARDFRRFVGCTAGQFASGDQGLAASLAAA